MPKPHWLLAELTYACPLQCPYCSNPLGYEGVRDELDTDEWLRVLHEARAMGAVQLGLSGGEPLVRRDLEIIIAEASRLGYYSNLITSGVGLTEERIAAFREAGLDHIQLSIQASTAEMNDYLAGTRCFDKKLEAARRVKQHGYPMVLCFVLHRHNIDEIDRILETAIALEADYVELATAQYHGWALVNRDQLLPTSEQLRRAEAVAHDYQARMAGRMKIYYVVPDYYEGRPKACMNGWGNIFLTVAPDGMVLPCHSARDLPGLHFPTVREAGLAEIWNDSPAFNRYRGDAWMKAPCRTCPEKEKDFGGCRCQAYMLTGDAANADPTCSLSPHHAVVETAIAEAGRFPAAGQPLVFRNPRSARALAAVKRPA